MNLQSTFNNDSENTNFLIVIPSQEIIFTKLQNFCYIWPRLHILNYFLSLHTLGHEPYGIYYLFTKIHKNSDMLKRIKNLFSKSNAVL